MASIYSQAIFISDREIKIVIKLLEEAIYKIEQTEKSEEDKEDVFEMDELLQDLKECLERRKNI